MGCSGYRGGESLADGRGTFLPCASAADYEALAGGALVNIRGEVCTLESNADITFTHPPTDMEKIRYIVPSGSPQGGVMKPHSYINVGGFGSNKGPLAPVYAPVDSWLVGIAYYQVGNAIEYLLIFDVTCEVSYRFDHITTVEAKVAPHVLELPATTHTTKVSPPLFFAAGDLIGTSNGAGNGYGPWDFGAYNTTIKNQFANQARYEVTGGKGLPQPLHGVCPYEMYDEPLLSQFRRLYGAWENTGYADAACTPARDVAGTVAGAWFQFEGGDFEPVFSIATLAEGMIQATAAGLDVRVMPGQAT